MERREAPGRCATAPLWGAGALRRTPRAPCKDRFARPIPRRARAVISGVRSPATEPLRLPAFHPAGERPAEGSRAALSAARLSAPCPARHDRVGLAGGSTLDLP